MPNQAGWEQVKDVFAAAAELAGEERAALLAAACGDDAELRAEVEALLACDRDAAAATFIECPMPAMAQQFAASAPPDPWIGRRLGAYRLLRRIGAGGMGQVFLAERADREFEKQVAVKLVWSDIDREALLERFRRERQLLAQLDHPHIARLLDGGSTEEGLPYLVMEYVEGRPIDVYCSEPTRSVDEILILFEKVAAAVHHAHQSLIVHRDLKPTNILVSDAGVPKLLDFGIAKVLGDGTWEAGATHAVMTPGYASPEQLRGAPINTASDVYSLGVILFELLAGRRPHRASNDAAALAQVICEQEPPPPSVHARRRFGKDLDNIVLMALRKEPERRYASVQQFCEDLARFRAGLPVHARRSTWVYRSERFVRRHKLAVGAALVVACSLGGFSFITSRQSIAVARERDRASTEAAHAARINGFLQTMLAAVDPNVEPHDVSVREVLDRAAQRIETELRDDPEARADVCTTIGNCYRSLGLYEQAEHHLRAALATRRERFGAEHHDVAQSLNNLAALLYAKGEYGAAEPLMREAIGIFDRAELSDPTVATARNNLACLLRKRGDLDTAEVLFRKALAERTRFFGRDHPDIAQTLNNLALLRAGRRDLAGAETLAREALDIRQRLLGASHPEVAQSLSNLGVVLQGQKRFAAAEELYRAALCIYRERLGQAHPDVAVVLMHLGGARMAQDDALGAESLLDEALAIRRVALEPLDDRIAESATTLARCRISIHRFAQAEQVLVACYEAARDDIPEDDAQLIRLLEGLVDLYTEWNHPEDARTYRELLTSAHAGSGH